MVYFVNGISSLGGVQLVERLELFIIPAKHQLDCVYTRHVHKVRNQLVGVLNRAMLESNSNRSGRNAF